MSITLTSPYGSRPVEGESLLQRVPAWARDSDWHPDWKTELVSRLLALRATTFIDVGANRGQTLLDYVSAAHIHQYLGFEPNCHCASLISDMIASSGRSDCRLVPAGLSDRNGVQSLLLTPGEKLDSSASIDAELRPGRSWSEQLVACYRFDDIRSSLHIEEAGLFKIDVEGAELAVLNGMEVTVAKDRPWLLCEILHRDSGVDAPKHQQRLDALMSWVARMDYAGLNVMKSADGLHFEGVAVVEDIPNKVWTWENSGECDYIFIPRTDVVYLSGALQV